MTFSTCQFKDRFVRAQMVKRALEDVMIVLILCRSLISSKRSVE